MVRFDRMVDEELSLEKDNLKLDEDQIPLIQSQTEKMAEIESQLQDPDLSQQEEFVN